MMIPTCIYVWMVDIIFVSGAIALMLVFTCVTTYCIKKTLSWRLDFYYACLLRGHRLLKHEDYGPENLLRLAELAKSVAEDAIEEEEKAKQ